MASFPVDPLEEAYPVKVSPVRLTSAAVPPTSIPWPVPEDLNVLLVTPAKSPGAAAETLVLVKAQAFRTASLRVKFVQLMKAMPERVTVDWRVTFAFTTVDPSKFMFVEALWEASNLQ
jgi:hypothetical protein